MRTRRPSFLRLALCLAFVGALAIGLASWIYTGPAAANGSMGCNAEAGHGTPGCHVEPTTTTAKPATSTTAKPATTTTKASTATTKASTGTTGTTTSNTGTTGATTSTATSSTGTTGATSSSVPTTAEASTTSEASTTTGAPAITAVPSAGSASAYDPSAPVLFVDQNNCLSCHGDPAFSKKQPDGTSISLYVDPAGLSHTVHRFQDCTTCHSSSPHEAQTPLTKLSLAEKCGSCHQYEYGQYIESVHGVPQASGNSDPATCTDCHSANSNPHNVVRVLDPLATTYPKNIAQTCAKCHDDPKLMGKYGIVEKVYDSYMRSFHGKAISLSGNSGAIEQLNTATCVNCHGSHNIALVSDPNSPVAGMENLAKTCEQCHPGAGVEFASGFLGHKEADPSFVPQVYWGEKFFFVFTRVILAGGVLMVVMPLGRMGVERIKRKGKPPKKEE
jgi:hypothetical protein